MIIFCEPIAWGLEHVPVNAALLKTIRLAYPDEIIRFYGEETHLKSVQEQIDNEAGDSIDWHTINLPNRHSSFYRRIYSDFKLVNLLFKQLTPAPARDLLVLTTNPSILWAIKYHINSIHKNKKVQAIIHGDFYPLSYPDTLKRKLRFLNRISSLKTALTISGYMKIQHIVLEEAVRESVVNKLPQLKDSMYVIDHPIPLDNCVEDTATLSSPIKFGFLGLATKNKGFLKYLEVASEISKSYPGKAEFHFIGRLSKAYQGISMPGLKYICELPGSRRLERNEYIKSIQSLHYVCMFFNEAYEYTASGILLDCIALGKPIVVTDISIFNCLEKRFGDIGYLCHPKDIIENVSSIIENVNIKRYGLQVSNLIRIRDSRSPKYLSVTYRDITEKLQLRIKSKLNVR